MNSYLLLGIYILLVVSLAVLVFFYAEAYGSTGILLSNTCLTMIKNNLTTNCPTYEEILTLFPDSLNTKIAGEFAYENGYYHRAVSRYGDSFNYYRYSDLDGNYVDPPQSLAARIRTITIAPNDFIYKSLDRKITNTSITVGQNRYMDGCSHAILSANDWWWSLGDTISFMNHNCDPAFTNFNDTKTIYWDAVKHDITTSYKWKLDNWFKKAIDECGTKICLYEKNQAKQPGRAGILEE